MKISGLALVFFVVQIQLVFFFSSAPIYSVVFFNFFTLGKFYSLSQVALNVPQGLSFFYLRAVVKGLALEILL